MSTKTATRTDQPETKLDTVKKSAAYLMYGSAAGASAVPKSWKTRSVLTTARYFSKYIFWRVLRYAKYAIAGAVATALGGTLLAGITSGATMLVAPSFFSATALGTGWAVTKFAWHHRPNSIRRIQANIENLLHLSPSSTTPTPGEALAASSSTGTSSSSWFERIRERAHSGSDAKDDEEVDHVGDKVQSEARDQRARASV